MQSWSDLVLVNSTPEKDQKTQCKCVIVAEHWRQIYVLYIFIYFVRLYDVDIVFTPARSSRTMCPVTNSSRKNASNTCKIYTLNRAACDYR